MKNKLFGSFLWIIFLLTVAACSSQETPSGTVMVRNVYYYKVQLSGGHTFWFVPSRDAMTDIQFFTDEKTVKEQAMTAKGTGFFVTDDGVMVAHAQVASPMVNPSDVSRALANQLVYLKQYYTADLELYNRRLLLVEDGFQTLEQERQEALRYVGGNLEMRAKLDRDYTSRRDKLTAMQAGFVQKRDSLKGVVRELDHFNNSQVSIFPVQQLSVACLRADGKHYGAWQPCTLMASNAKTGLAVLRLGSQRTPDSCHVFDISPDDGIFSRLFGGIARLFGKGESDNRLFVVGVKDGRPCVFPESRVDNRGGSRFGFSTPVPAGNWGSPVVDRSGKLIGVTSSDSGNDSTGTCAIRIEQLFRLVKVNF